MLKCLKNRSVKNATGGMVFALLLIATAAHTGAAPITFDNGEIVVPSEIVEGAKREGKVVIRSSIDPPEWEKFVKSFKEKVPFIKVEHTKAPFKGRVRKTIIEYRAGRVIADIITGITGGIPTLLKLDMMTDISDIPTFRLYDKGLKEKNGRWIARQITFWGIGYRTDRVSKGQLRTWDDIVNPKWGPRLATANKPHLLPHILWSVWGPERTKAWLKRLFATGMQFRKEGSGAVARLLSAGEFDVLFSTHAREIRSQAEQGAQVAWTFPEGPVYPLPGFMVLLKGSPHPNAAKLFLTYWTSKEGQIAQFKVVRTIPVHPGLMGKSKYLSWPEELANRKVIIGPVEERLKVLRATRKFWKKLWLGD